MSGHSLTPMQPISLETPPRTPVSGGNHAKVENGRVQITVYSTGLTWDEARRLRDWLTGAIDEDKQGPYETDA
jgi:hypothetical protein